MIGYQHSRLLAAVIGALIIHSSVMAYGDGDIQQNKGPVIISSEKELILQKGQNYTIICRANTPVQIKQQEISEDVISLFNMTQRNMPSSDPMYLYETALDLTNVDQLAVGYYACFDNTTKNDSEILNNFVEEPKDNEHVSYIYIYVNGTDNIFAPMREVVISRGGLKVAIECRPTTPDVEVSLHLLQSNQTPEILMYSSKIGFLMKLKDLKETAYKCIGPQGNWKLIRNTINVETPPPKIVSNSLYFLEGETFSLNCTTTYQSNSPVELTWNIPRPFSKGNILNDTNEREATGGILYKKIIIVNATAEDEGTYTCTSKTTSGVRSESKKKIYRGTNGFISLKRGNPINPIETFQGMMKLKANVNAHPPANFSVVRDGYNVHIDSRKYFLKVDRGSVILDITSLNINDTGNYTIIAKNDYVTTNVTFDLRVKAAPIIDFGLVNVDKKVLMNTIASLECRAIGYPQPIIDWVFTNERGQEKALSAESRSDSIIKTTSILKIPARTSGTITCHAHNSVNRTSLSRRFLIYEVPDGFGLDSQKSWFSEGDRVLVQCYASKYDFTNVTWIDDEGELLEDNIIQRETAFSYIAQLIFDGITLDQAGNYTCIGEQDDVERESYTITISVEARRLPVINLPVLNEEDLEVNPYQPIQLTCQADAVPPPTITWLRDGVLIQNSSQFEIVTDYLNLTTVNSTITIEHMMDENKGKYECIIQSGDETQSKFYNLLIKEKSTFKAAYLGIIGVIVFVLLLLVVYLAWKIRKEKQFRKELAAAGLLYFKEGVPRSINPDLGIDEQAELLPYDDRYEFPADKLVLGKQLGAGAFGVVYKAEARGIINAEETTTVAVKMVKKTADNMYIKALASELKIMVHLGKHINIVNLLGACTKNVGKRELVVIVEYCQFGNIHNYMMRHREVFIDQLTDNKEKNLGKVNKAFSYSTGSTGMQSDYFGSNQTQETDNTFINSANTNRSVRKVSEAGYIQPEWRSNYECDYSYDGLTPRPLTSRDLLAWGFQIARGMEYLASRKVLHGDLAARNVLLADDNIVKICDFGLARSIYKNDEYQKKENSPLPVKWLAVECMTDRIFSTQSDVWSFGIVLWELFSLAKTPYPNISPSHLLKWLSEGNRLEKPTYADDRLYDVMRRCWEQKPTVRPTFSQLQEILGSFLEDNVRNHYVDLNSSYMDTNLRVEGQEDYLAMVTAPDYNNIVTPSPCHYVNESTSFFPPTTPMQLQHDDEGYLQMSPANKNSFNPRVQSTKFDFDARKLNPRPTEAMANTHGTELTPMLTLNNLPARSGSESDQDTNSSSYLKMCPRIEEESDEVFVTKDYNNKNSKNSAVSNPSYITFDVEKKPNNLSNNYINISVPNGLVK
ncbi:vascular endothelial growth factor receptor 1 isoform X2 [Leptidea sinapis]|uniref:vascular endothelial growth factor receptor 1 isoform X2 n=1 Tax=Leptidea sinapis TaxID=189913 RepID=UPI0021C3C7EF|nr:vascular endothelial growth factor receptor 1 isoform X2 [Leptidea sinapis]